MRLLQVFYTFLLAYSLTEDTIAESQLREESDLDGRSFIRAWGQLVEAKIIGRETNGLKGRAARTRWWYVSDEEAGGLSGMPARTPAGMPAEIPAPVRVTEYRTPSPEGTQGNTTTGPPAQGEVMPDGSDSVALKSTPSSRYEAHRDSPPPPEGSPSRGEFDSPRKRWHPEIEQKFPGYIITGTWRDPGDFRANGEVDWEVWAAAVEIVSI